MKHYQRKISLDKNSSDSAKATPRKSFNSSERQYAKKDIKSTLDLSLEDKEIKIVALSDLRRALDKKLENIRFSLAVSLHALGIPLLPGGEKKDFSYYWQHCDFEYEVISDHLTEEEILEILALEVPNNVIDIESTLQKWERSRYY